MPDLLLLSLDTKSFFALEALGTAHGYRVKSTTEASSARDWMRLRPFSIVLVDSKVPPDVQHELAGILWKNSPLSPFIVFDLDHISEEAAREVLLFGADAAFGPDALDIIAAKLKRSAQQPQSAEQELKILVVEDLDSPRDIICFYLESLGLGAVSGVRSGREAMAALESDPKGYSCVITDIRMPELNGKELIELIRGHEKLRHIPVVALTAYGTVDTLVECLKAGASGFLVKPPKRDDLTRELARALRIIGEGSSPRLANSQEAELLRDLLIEKGFS